MEKNLTATLYKNVFQVRYKPELKFYTRLMEAAGELEGYPDWETDIASVKLMDYEKHCSVTIQHNALTYEQDSSDVALGRSRATAMIETLPERLGIEHLTRVGYRGHYLIGTETDFESLVKIIDSKLLSQDERLRAFVPEPTDVLYRVDFQETPYGCHLSVGPVRKEELPRYIPINQAYHLNPKSKLRDYHAIAMTYPERAILVDIDFFLDKEELSGEDVKGFIETAYKKHSELNENLIHYLFTERLED